MAGLVTRSVFLYRSDNVVVGLASQAYTWVAFAKERCTAMVLRVSSQMPQRGSRNLPIKSWVARRPPRLPAADHGRAVMISG